MEHENAYIPKLLVIVLLLTGFTAVEAATRWYFRTVDVKDGLADNFVRDIATDSEGYVWLSTINGVSRYDGYRFLNFQPQHYGGRTGDVAMVRQTADGTLWMRCTSGELFTYRPATQTWQKDGMERLRQMGMEGNDVSAFVIDEQGGLWVATERGVYHGPTGQDNRCQHYDYRGTGAVRYIVRRGGVTMAVTADYNIYKVEDGVLTYVTRHPAPFADRRDVRVILDSRMNLWIYEAHSLAGTQWVYAVNERQWRQATELSQLGNGVMVNVIADDNEGRLWIGTGNHGIYVLAHEGQDGSTVSCRPLSSHITCLFADRNNTMWVGSAKLGAAFADLNSPDFVHTVTEGHEDVSALMEDAQGLLWIGFDGSGVMAVDAPWQPSVGRTRTYSAQNGQLPSDNVTTLSTNGRDGILVGTYGGGIAQLSGDRFVTLYPECEQLRYVKAMMPDRHGSLWVATVDKGIVRITDGRITIYNTGNSPLRSDGTICLAYDAPGDIIYIGTSIGLAAYDCSRGHFINDHVTDSLKNVSVTALLVDNGGQLWIGSRDGLWIKGRQLVRLTTDQGLSHNVVRALAMRAETVWASTDNGLTSITMQGDEWKCRPFFGSDGLHSIIFNNNAALTATDGTVLLGCLSGYISIPINNVLLGQRTLARQERSMFNVHFTEFRINGNTVVKSPQGFSIDYDERLGISISIMVPALSHKARYWYRFKGEDEWMRAPGNMLYFASLMPGNHVLQVKAELAGMAMSEVSELHFRVVPPFWLSKPAIVGYLLLLAAIGWLVWRAIRRRQQRELAMKQMELNLKKYEIEEQKISFFTNISHDIKTPLTMVMAPLEKIRNTSLPAAVHAEIDVAWQNARQLYDLVLELLDFRRLDEGKEMLNLSHGELVSFVRQIVQGFDYIAQRRNITIELHLPDKPIETTFDQNKVRRVLINLLSNAFKYNAEGGSVAVTLSEAQPSFVQVSIADTGIGIKDKHHVFDRFVQETHGQEQEGSGLGLHIVRHYVDMMGGSISVSDNKPRGTIFTVTLPLNVETSNSQLSTPNAPLGQRTLAGQERSNLKTTILVVEDNIDARLFLQRSLEDEYHVLLAGNGKEALNQLAAAEKLSEGEHSPATSVSLIVSDVMMPVMDGIELVRQIRQDIRYSHIPVILLTAKSSEDDIVAGLKEGVADYLTKPYSLAVLRLRIKNILEWTQRVHEQVANGIEIKPSEITVSSLDEELISHVIGEVEAHIGDPNYSVVQLSAAVGMTRGTLYKKLMAIVGKSPVEFIRTVRLKRGKDLLDQGRTNISEVADSVGFSPKMFAQHFREMYGDTPSDYLKHKKIGGNVTM